jgi:hypothetical protein
MFYSAVMSVELIAKFQSLPIFHRVAERRLKMCGVTGWKPFDNYTPIKAGSGDFFAHWTSNDLMAVAHA